MFKPYNILKENIQIVYTRAYSGRPPKDLFSLVLKY